MTFSETRFCLTEAKPIDIALHSTVGYRTCGWRTPCRRAVSTILFGAMLAVALLLAPAGIAAQPATQDPAVGGDETEAAKSRLDVARLEREYDTYLTNMIGAYFDPGSFFVHTQIAFTMVEQQLRERATDQAVTEIMEQALPGLAVIPDFMRQAGRQPDERRERTLVQLMPDIDRLTIELTIRDDYSDEEEAFIAYLAGASAKLNDERGDRIRVIRRSFPERSSGAPPMVPGQELPAVAPVPGQESSGAWPSDIVASLVVLWEEYPQILAAGLGSLALILLLLMVLGIRRSRRRKAEAAVAVRDRARRSESRSEEMPVPESPTPAVRNGTSAALSETRVKEKVFAGRPPEEHQPEEIMMRYFMHHTDDMARLLDEWIVTRDAAGVMQAVRLLLATDPKLAERLRPTMDTENWNRVFHSLKQEVASRHQPDRAAPDPVIAEVTETLRRRERSGSLYFRLRTLRNFDFLDYAQIKLLVRAFSRAEPEMLALIAAHLTPERLDAFLWAIPKDRIPSIWSAMDRVRIMKRQEYIGLAREVFKAMTRAEKQIQTNLEPDNDIVEMVASRIENQPVAEQNSMFKRFQADDSPISVAVTKYLITMENLADVPDEAIRAACEPMDAQELAYALSGEPAERLKRILVDRPQRERQLFESLLMERDTFGSEQAEQAMQAMLVRLRTIIRNRERVPEKNQS